MKKDLLFAFSLIGSVGFVTATPAVVFGIVGRLLDRHFASEPKIFIVLMLFALVVSVGALRKIAQRAAQEMDSLNKKTNK